MASDLFSLDEAEEEIADLRGQADKLSEILTIGDSFVPNTPAVGFSLFSLLGVPQVVGDSGNTGAVPSTQSDVSANTVTQATTNQLSGQFTVPANDANIGTVYRLWAGGFGTWGTSGSGQQLTLIQILGGTNVNQINIAAAAFGLSDPFDWELEQTYVVVTTGSSGTCRVLLRVSINKNNAAVTTAAPPNNLTGVRQTGSVTFNTTVSRTMRVNALWNATTGTPTITCDRTTFERIGP